MEGRRTEGVLAETTVNSFVLSLGSGQKLRTKAPEIMPGKH